MLAALLPAVLPFVRSHWKLASVGALALAVGVYVALLKYQVSRLNTQVAVAEATIEKAKRTQLICDGNVKSLEEAIGQHNRAIGELKRHAEEEAANAAKRAENILKRSGPKVGPGAAEMNRWLEGQ